MAQQTINIGAVANDRTGDTWRSAMEKSNSNFDQLFAAKSSKIVMVKTASDLAGILDPSALYVIDGIIDMGSQSIEVPAGGLNLAGHTFDVSQLITSAPSYTMFTSPAGGSGNLIGRDYGISVTGTGSQVYDLVSDTGNEAFEFARINYNNCVDLGVIDNYRQGLEVGTGRFGGQPSLELKGAWAGGYFIDTSIVRGIDNAMTGALFEAGTAFVMQSRFRSNMNVDLGTLAAYFDFAAANFPNPNTLQIQGSIVTRNGASNASDTTVAPNITASELPSAWTNNIGLSNTFPGGELTITSETATVIAAASTFYDIAGTWTATDLQHFDSPANGQIRHLGDNPTEYKVIGDLLIDSTANNELEIRVRRWDDSASAFVVEGTQLRQVNNLVGGRNVAFFNFNIHVTLDQNDYIIMQVANNTAANNATAELNSSIIVETR